MTQEDSPRPSVLAARRRMDIGLALMAEGDAAAAFDCFAAAAEADPDWADAHFALAEAAEALGRRDTAIAGYSGYLARAGEDGLGALPRLALLGAAVVPDRLPPAYVRRLFDDYAPRFDTALAALDYRGPQLLRGLWDRLAPDRPDSPGETGPTALSVLDLGCGTGLSGAAFADLAGRLEGVDLAPAMVSRARQRGCYAAVLRADLVDALNAEPAAGRDLLIAADALNYLGDLAPCIAAAARVLRPGGLFLLTLEAGEDAPVALGPGQRYRHSAAYLTATATAAGLSVAALEPGILRLERQQPVPGLVVALLQDGRSAAGAAADRRDPQDPPIHGTA